MNIICSNFGGNKLHMKYISIDQDGKIFVDGIEYGPINNKAGVPEPKKEINCYEDLGTVGGFYVGTDSDIAQIESISACEYSKCLFPTREEAEAALAMSQLCQLRDRANEGWMSGDNTPNGYIWYISKSSLLGGYGAWKDRISFNYCPPLTFKNKEIAEKFLVTHKELIKQALPLM